MSGIAVHDEQIRSMLMMMDFIERILHVSPDGGSGTFEAMLTLIPMIVVIGYSAIRKRVVSGRAFHEETAPK